MPQWTTILASRHHFCAVTRLMTHVNKYRWSLSFCLQMCSCQPHHTTEFTSHFQFVTRVFSYHVCVLDKLATPAREPWLSVLIKPKRNTSVIMPHLNPCYCMGCRLKCIHLVALSVKRVASMFPVACLLKLPTVAVRGAEQYQASQLQSMCGSQQMLGHVFGAWGFTWASQVGVCVVPGVLVILEHVQASGLKKNNLYENAWIYKVELECGKCVICCKSWAASVLVLIVRWKRLMLNANQSLFEGHPLSHSLKPYLCVLDLQGTAAWVDVCSVERCLSSLCALHRVKRDDRVKEKTLK